MITIKCFLKYSGECHRCENAENCATAIENPKASDHSMAFSTDIEDIDAIYSLVNSNEEKPKHNKPAKQTCKLELEKYYEGEQHQSERHVIVIMCQVLLMTVVSTLRWLCTVLAKYCTGVDNEASFI